MNVLQCFYICDYFLYLGAFLWSVQAHHVVSEKLLQELHLGNAEVEIQTAGHVHLQGVATHHHLLKTQGRQSRGRLGKEGGGSRKHFQSNIRTVVWPDSGLLPFERMTNPSLSTSTFSVFLSWVPPTVGRVNLSQDVTSERILLTDDEDRATQIIWVLLRPSTYLHCFRKHKTFIQFSFRRQQVDLCWKM